MGALTIYTCKYFDTLTDPLETNILCIDAAANSIEAYVYTH